MTKSELVTKITKTTHIDEQSVLIIVESFMTTVKGTLKKRENIKLKGFGSFIVKHRAEKTARNIHTNALLIVPAHNIPAFKPSKELLNKIKQRSLLSVE